MVEEMIEMEVHPPDSFVSVSKFYNLYKPQLPHL